MKNSNIYTTNEYIKRNPTLHEEDSEWKVTKIIPLVDIFLDENNKKEITLLDVGGGAGIILKEIANYIRKRGIKVKKYSLDLSSGMLKIQKKNNKDIKKLLNEDIKKTSLKNKEIDLTLMIDVLEHVPNPEEALKELRRISKYVIFKVPLENNLLINTLNRINNGKTRKKSSDKFGHINFYNYHILKDQIEKDNGIIIFSRFTNYFGNIKLKGKLVNKLGLFLYIKLGLFLYCIHPKVSSTLFPDFSMILVKSYKNQNER